MEILHNDEGMWLPYALPLKRLKKLYGFTPDSEWFTHVERASAKMVAGLGSGSFVSRRGLIYTNHHIALEFLQNVSSSKKNYVRDGFLARNHSEELKIPHEEVNVLWETEDVTERVNEAVKPSMSLDKAQKARQAEIIRIEEESYKKQVLKALL